MRRAEIVANVRPKCQGWSVAKELAALRRAPVRTTIVKVSAELARLEAKVNKRDTRPDKPLDEVQAT